MSALAEPLYALVATVGFAVIFRVPRALLLSVGVGGGLGWWFFLGVRDLSASVIFATFLAAMWVGAYGEALARITRRPATIFSTCAIIPLVPGRAIFEMMVGAVRRDPVFAMTQGLWTIAVAGAIASGLALVAALMPRSRGRILDRKP